jgi:Fe-S-cluster-containing hydrogenase component 2
MAHVVTADCTKDMACAKVCPNNCIYDAGAQVVINADECMDCGLCAQECPVNAIFPADEVPGDKKASVDVNKNFFAGKSAGDLDKARVPA